MYNFNLESEYVVGDKVKFIRECVIYGSDKKSYICPVCRGYSTKMLYCHTCNGKGIVESNRKMRATEVCVGTIQNVIFSINRSSFEVSYHIAVEGIVYQNISEKQILGLMKGGE